MIASARRAGLFLPVLLLVTGCARTIPTALPAPTPAQPKPPGVTANSGGDTRGTILYQPGPLPAVPPDPYAALSSQFVLPERQKMAWALAEIDRHAHLQAENAYPVPAVPGTGYAKIKAQTRAEQQAQFNAYLLEKYHARFCNQFGITYDQLALIIQEGRDKNWPMPPDPKD